MSEKTRSLTKTVLPCGLVVLAALLSCSDAVAASRRRSRRSKGMTEQGKMDYKANDVLNRGVELLGMKQEDRALKLISSVPRMFPKSKIRFKAYLVVGQHHMKKRRYDLAIKQFRHLEESEDVDQKAEGLYQVGVCYYNTNDFDKAFMSLRKVTSEFPWSVYANEAYYYIGHCHFKLGRWSKAVEALKMVGTSVPTNVEGEVRAEAGQRLFVKIFDKDLVVLSSNNETLSVEVATSGGDRERGVLEPLGRGGEYQIGSLQTAPGEAVPGNGTLEIVGGDLVKVHYLDINTESGERNAKRLAKVRLVSSATVGFTDGAYREYTNGIFGDSDAFIRVKDLDRDRKPTRDRIEATVFTRYKLEKEEGQADESGEVEYETRDSVEVDLVETGQRTGIFVGTVLPRVVAAGDDISAADDDLSAVKGDEVVVEYTDELHMAGPDPREIDAKAKLLLGQIQDVKIEYREVDNADLKARKNLIEAKIFQKLGGIFKDVGLTKKAAEKAEQGLERVEDVISTSLAASLDRDVVEEAFSVKWELLLVQDKLKEAIGVCRTLMSLYPDSSLVDNALLKVGLAKMEGDDPGSAVPIFNAVINLPKSDLKAEAQYHIAAVLERAAKLRVKESGRKPDLSRAMMAYKRCAESYPDSSFAGEALDKIANYYIINKDYARALELMERIFNDYPDASFLDKMLLKWVIAAYRTGNLQLAKQKVEQLLSEYPNSKFAKKARKFKTVIERKMNR